MSAKKSNLLTKKVAFAGKEMTLYSIDGVTWSTRPDELELIVQRHNTEQAAFSSDLKGEERDKTQLEKIKPKPKKFTRVHNDDELDEVIDEDVVDDIDDDLPPDLDVDIEADLDDDEIPLKALKGSDKKPLKGIPTKSAPAKATEKKSAPKTPAKAKVIAKTKVEKKGAMKAKKAKPAPKAKKPVSKSKKR